MTDQWCRQWDSNLLLTLARRKLLILRYARNGKPVRIAQFGYAAGTRQATQLRGSVSDKGVMQSVGRPPLGKWQDFF